MHEMVAVVEHDAGLERFCDTQVTGGALRAADLSAHIDRSRGLRAARRGELVQQVGRSQDERYRHEEGCFADQRTCAKAAKRADGA